MAIDIRKFVDINIQQHIYSSTVSTRDTVVLYTNDGTSGTTRTISTLTEATTYYSTYANTLAYLTMYFNNGGKKVLVIEGTDIDDLTSAVISELDNKYICVAYVTPVADLEANYGLLKAIAVTRQTDTTIHGINEKIILARTAVVSDATSLKNFGVKYSSIQGAEMTIAAYLSQIDVYGIDTIKDYAFTVENITAENLTDANFDTLSTNNMNVDITLANQVMNVGGNLKNGADLINSYVRIILHQTLTDRLLNLLINKIKNQSGVNKIYGVLAQELNNYVSCGYLTKDKIWTDEDVKITYNEVEYTIVSKGTPLLNGYLIKVLPFSSLSDTDKADKKAPPIYVILADQYGIRKITINGEVI